MAPTTLVVVRRRCQSIGRGDRPGARPRGRWASGSSICHQFQVAKRSPAGHRAAAVSAAGSPTFSIWSRRIGVSLLAMVAAGPGTARAADEAAIQTAAQASRAAPVGRGQLQPLTPGVFDTGLWPEVDDLRDNLEAEGWLLQGQFTYIQQGHPRFRSPYQGENSLTNGKKTRETMSF